MTLAPTRGATPTPPEDATETITPPIGNLFLIASSSLIYGSPVISLVPLNTTSTSSSLVTIEYTFRGLLSVD